MDSETKAEKNCFLNKDRVCDSTCVAQIEINHFASCQVLNAVINLPHHAAWPVTPPMGFTPLHATVDPPEVK